MSKQYEVYHCCEGDVQDKLNELLKEGKRPRIETGFHEGNAGFHYSLIVEPQKEYLCNWARGEDGLQERMTYERD